jgi:hypothetical protein
MLPTIDFQNPARTVRQPGPALEPRASVVPASGRLLSFVLEPGRSLLAGLDAALSAEGFSSAAVALEGGGFGPFDYVKPALSRDGANAAFYSEVFRPEGVTRIEQLRVTFGRRDGAAWLHGHGFWREASGIRSGGHVMPHETIVAAPIRARAWAFAGAEFVAEADAETNFSLFGPIMQAAAAAPNCFAVRLRPNQDICGAIEDICARGGIAQARIEGGVASIIGAQFEDGRVISNFATEMFVRSGVVRAGVAALDVGFVDYTGLLSEGRLRRGANPVLMTAELVIVPTA